MTVSTQLIKYMPLRPARSPYLSSPPDIKAQVHSRWRVTLPWQHECLATDEQVKAASGVFNLSTKRNWWAEGLRGIFQTLGWFCLARFRPGVWGSWVSPLRVQTDENTALNAQTIMWKLLPAWKCLGWLPYANVSIYVVLLFWFLLR